MKAIFIHKAKDLRISEIEPQALNKNEVRVKIERGGICGSDLHYFNHGGFGTNFLKEPMILGHEVSGTILETGNDVRGLDVGDLVAISPSQPCDNCTFCRQGHTNHCIDMKFYGSAMLFPHIQGAFRQEMVVNTSQCVLSNDITSAQAAMVEPLSVVLHALKRVGQIFSKNFLVCGAGPIGLLTVQCLKASGASNIVVTDIVDEPLKLAEKLGASETFNVRTGKDIFKKYSGNKGWFDTMFECSGSESALMEAVSAIKPRGLVVQLGMSGNMKIPMQFITTKEIKLLGSFRFHDEFFEGVQCISSGTIDVQPLISHAIPLSNAELAFETANDRCKSMKVQIIF